MTKRVILQAGHSAQFVPFLVNGGGAPGEHLWTGELAVLIAERLRKAGVEVDIVGTWAIFHDGKLVVMPAPAEVKRDADLFVALHYDGTSPTFDSGCLADRARLDPCAVESDRFIAMWRASFPAVTGIPYAPFRSNPNTTDYYAFRDTTDKTAGVLLEHGCGSLVAVGDCPPGKDATYLREKIHEVADIDAVTILEFLGVPTPPLPDVPVDVCAEIREHRDALIGQVGEISAERDQYAAGLHYSDQVKAQLEHYLRTTVLYTRKGSRFVRVGNVADELIASVRR